MRLTTALLATAALAACAGRTPPPTTSHQLAFLPPVESPSPRMESLDHWLGALRCRERPTMAMRAECYVAAARMRDATEKLLRGMDGPETVRT